MTLPPTASASSSLFLSATLQDLPSASFSTGCRKVNAEIPRVEATELEGDPSSKSHDAGRLHLGDGVGAGGRRRFTEHRVAHQDGISVEHIEDVRGEGSRDARADRDLLSQTQV